MKKKKNIEGEAGELVAGDSVVQTVVQGHMKGGCLINLGVFKSMNEESSRWYKGHVVVGRGTSPDTRADQMEMR